MKKLITLDPTRLQKDSQKLKDFLVKRIIGQHRAIDCIVNSYDYYNSQLCKTGEGPILASIFLGPSGVGKTHIVECFAEFLFGNPLAFTKIECGNYQERHTLATLLGAPPGYIGYNDPSESSNPPLLDQRNIDKHARQRAKQEMIKKDATAAELYEMARQLEQTIKNTENSYWAKRYRDDLAKVLRQLDLYIDDMLQNEPLMSIILFDEIERAHDAIHKFLLEVTSKGRTRLLNGVETSFYNSFIFMTSNAGSDVIADILSGKNKVGFLTDQAKGEDAIHTEAMEKLKEIFKPEFIGRVKDNIVVFRPLTKDEIWQIMELAISELTNEIERLGRKVIIEKDVKQFILDKALDHPEYGARLIKSKILVYLQRPLSRLIATGQFLKDETVTVKLKRGEIVFVNQQNKEMEKEDHK